jgi:hypothetical protein
VKSVVPTRSDPASAINRSATPAASAPVTSPEVTGAGDLHQPRRGADRDIVPRRRRGDRHPAGAAPHRDVSLRI